MKKMNKRGKRILVMVLVFAILCTSLPCTPTIPVHAAQAEKNGTWYEVDSRINASWGGHITGEITLTNVSSQTRQDWHIAFPWQAQITSMWNGNYEETENGYLITPMEYNRELAPEASVSVGFIAEGEDSELKRLAEEAFFQEEGASITDAEERENMTPAPSVDVTGSPSGVSTANPSAEAAVSPTAEPIASPSAEATVSPSEEPTASPSEKPTVSPSEEPAARPTVEPTASPSLEPTDSPGIKPTAAATVVPTEGTATAAPSLAPTAKPIPKPTVSSTVEPTVSPAIEPTATSTTEPTASPTVEPTASPTVEPTPAPTTEPTASPTVEPAEDLYIYTDTTISEDLVCGNLFLMGGSLECNGHSITVQKDYFQNGGWCSLSETSMSVAGDVHMAAGDLSTNENSIICVEGNFIAQNADSIDLQYSNIDIRGDLDCSFRDQLCQYYGSMEIGGDLIIRKGKYSNSLAGDSRIKGDVRILEEGWLHQKIYEGKGMEVGGDVLIDSRKSSSLECGRLAVHGNLTQTEESAEDSLIISGSFILEFCGESRQKLDIAHPKSTILGTLDLRKSPGVETPDFIRGRQLWGFAKMGKKQKLHLEMTDMQMVQNETIDCSEVEWKGSLQGDGYDFMVNGDLSMYGGGKLLLDRGKIQTGSLHLDDMQSAAFSYTEITIEGDMECSTRDQLCQYYGSMEIGGDLIIRKGKYSNTLAGDSRIKGDVRILEEGWLHQKIYEGKGMEVGGDVLIDSRKSSSLECGKLAVHGNLTQTEESAEDSLITSGSFILEFCGESRQKLDIAHPESTILGTLDLRKSPGVETPDFIRGRQLWGFAKMGKKQKLHLEMTDMQMVQNETIDCSEVEWKGSIQGDGYDFMVKGDLSMYGGGKLLLDRGKIQTGSLHLDDMQSAAFSYTEITIEAFW